MMNPQMFYLQKIDGNYYETSNRPNGKYWFFFSRAARNNFKAMNPIL